MPRPFVPIFGPDPPEDHFSVPPRFTVTIRTMAGDSVVKTFTSHAEAAGWAEHYRHHFPRFSITIGTAD